MTAEIVNLNKVRKARERAVREREAQQNRIKYGQSKIDRSLIDAQHRKSLADLEGARREPGRPSENEDDIDPGNAS
jgi:hypothetical protein